MTKTSAQPATAARVSESANQETPVKVGVIGCGTISGIYLQNARRLRIIDVVACADIDLERAQARALEWEVPRACSVAELLADPTIELVLNLTIPAAHASVTLSALQAGKHVYSEKPFALSREEARHILDVAEAKGLRVGCAPDTFLGGGLQTCRKLIDDGWIGTPVAAVAFVMGHGPERWHPDPGFFYLRGGGPMLDMGPYYVTALVSLLGPVKRVTGSARAAFPERVITSEARYGERIPVETPTHLAGVLDFESGVVATLTTSFDVWTHTMPRMEIYGTEGSLSVPDPNFFAGPARVRRAGAEAWSEVPLSHGYIENSRGIGVAEMAYALRAGRSHRASGAQAAHVLDVMLAVEEASAQGQHIAIQSSVQRPLPLVSGLLEEETLRA